MEIGWFFIALGSPFLVAITNFVDKYLTDHMKAKELPTAVLLLYSTLFSIVVLPTAYLLGGGLDSLGVINTFILVGAGVIEVVAVALYLFALSREETSIVIPLFQLIPVFSFIFGFLLLGEMLTPLQMLGGFVVMAGGLVLTLEFSEESKFKLKKTVLLLMLGSCVAYALFDALFKYAGSSESFWTAVFWQHVGILLVGSTFVLVHRRYRNVFFTNVRTSGIRIFSLNIFNEAMYGIGVMLLSFALFFAPIALVATVTVYQPVFVLLGGVLLTLYFPRLISEDISFRHLLHKGVAICIILAGSVFLLI